MKAAVKCLFAAVFVLTLVTASPAAQSLPIGPLKPPVKPPVKPQPPVKPLPPVKPPVKPPAVKPPVKPPVVKPPVG